MATELVKKEETIETESLIKLVPLSEVVARKKQLDEYIRGGLVENKDFGVIPSTDKPTLFKPGAEQILAWTNCYVETEVISEIHDIGRKNTYRYFVKSKNKWIEGTSEGFHSYDIRVIIKHRPTGQVVGTGVGSCSTMEKKYISVPNDSQNTVFKMGKKRALIDGVLTSFGLSDRFTQDVEDMEHLKEEKKEASTSSFEQDVPDQQIINGDPQQQTVKSYPITEKQRKFAYAKARSAGVHDHEMRPIGQMITGKASTGEWTNVDLDKWVKFLEDKGSVQQALVSLGEGYGSTRNAG